MRAVASYPVLTEEQERELAEKYRETGDLQAAWALVCSHLRQVASIAFKYSGYGLPEMDLIQEGSIGLMKAVKKFDPDKKVRLSTYATYWIKAAIHEFVLRNWRIVRVATTSSQRKLFFNLRRMTRNLGRRLSIQEADRVAGELDVKRSDVLEMEKRMKLDVAPFDPILDDGDDKPDTSPSAVMASDEGRHAEMIVAEDEDSGMKLAALREAISSLDERERTIISERTLAEKGEGAKLHDLAERFEVSAERVRQIEKRALEKIEKHVLAACG